MLRKSSSFSGALLVFLLSLPITAAGQTQPPAQTPPQATPALVPSPPPATTTPSSDLSYRIGPGDELDVRVFGRAELTRIVRVDSYGKIRLPFLDETQAACFTEAQLALAIAEKYKKYLRDPQVDVMVKDFRSQPVAVIGAVAQPGRFQLQRRVRLLELITFAGGPHTRAGATVHVIHSAEHDYCAQDPAGQQPKAGESGDSPAYALSAIKLRDLLAGALDANPFVQPGDIISIPEADQIFVTGSVIKPGAYPMLNKITLTQAVGLAGGPNMEAARGRVRLIRDDPAKGERKETVYNLDDIHRRKIQDVTLMPNDIIDIPSSTLRVASRNILGVSINMLSTLPYFVIR
jgi:polysaccharide export outer membrane protein